MNSNTVIEIVKIVVQLVQVAIWPLTVIFIVRLFKAPLMRLLYHITAAKLPGGVEVTISDIKKEAKIEEATEAISQIEKQTVDSTQKTELLRQVLTEVISNNDDRRTNPAQNMDTKDRTMVAFATGKSMAENVKYGVYYDPVDRVHQHAFKYLGLYNDRTVTHIGEVKKIVSCDWVDGQLIIREGSEKLTPEEYNRIKSTIEEAPYEPYVGHKFHLVEKFHETYFRKATPYGIMSKKYFWLDEIPGFYPGMSARELAALLDGKTWQ